MKKAISAVIPASLMLAGCSKEEVSYDPNVLNEYAISSSDYSTLNYLYSFSSADYAIIANLIDGLVEQDNYGNIIPALAESW